ncbi:SPX domain-containing protein 1-like isoform X2 [Carica papaya]|uniref:SPX domain-containing protein 1-like isoform X2 n=1 Tax=Carica papaya TaxID=3649 RepID=UPI000B8CD1B1|nr:SPX domain-containing protein 1-like isoform X2 [Carica papaya]
MEYAAEALIQEMKNGKRHRAEVANSLPEWEREFMSYKALKKQVKLIHYQLQSGNNTSGIGNGDRSNGGTDDLGIGFSQLLDSELEKVNKFYADKEEDYIIRLKEIQIKVTNLVSNEEKLIVQKDILDFHAEMVLLLHYSVVNYTGLVKIVKKHKKRAGESIGWGYAPRVFQQPFFSTELLYKLMKECEAMLSFLSVRDEP